MSDKDCFEIAAFERYFPDATHLLCQFHALKAFDVRLNKKVDGKGLKSEEKMKSVSILERQCMPILRQTTTPLSNIFLVTVI